MIDFGRMLSDGLPYPDVAAADALVADGHEDRWFEFWIERSREYERRGDEAAAAGARVTAGELLWLASLCAHYAQFMWFHDPERREAGQRRKVELYERAAPLLRPPAERIAVTVGGVEIPGFLRLPPDGSGPPPLVLLIGGLESTKEESHRFEDLCLARGLATFSFDGPGQGEVFFALGLQPDFERYASAVVDRLVADPRLDAERIGVVGRSLGGHYAPKLAATDERIAACCAWGACFDLEGLEAMPAGTRDGFIYVTRIADRDRAIAYLREAIDLAPVAARIRCPTLVVHGRHDTIFGADQVEKFRSQVVNAPLEVVVDPDGDHCCHNLGHLVRPRIADWVAARLGAIDQRR